MLCVLIAEVKIILFRILEACFVIVVILEEMEYVIGVQTLNEAVCISLNIIAIVKGMNPSLLSPTIGK